MVAADGGGCPTEGYAKMDFGRCTGSEEIGIRKAYQEGVSVGRGQQQVMAVDGSAASDTCCAQVIGGPCV